MLKFNGEASAAGFLPPADPYQPDSGWFIDLTARESPWFRSASGTHLAHNLSAGNPQDAVGETYQRGTEMKERKHYTGDTPRDFQPLGKDYPLKGTDVTGEPEQHLADNAAAYENAGEKETEPGVTRRGPFEVPDDDLAGEGWIPPTRPHGGWEHPVETAMEEQLEEVENPEEM